MIHTSTHNLNATPTPSNKLSSQMTTQQKTSPREAHKFPILQCNTRYSSYNKNLEKIFSHTTTIKEKRKDLFMLAPTLLLKSAQQLRGGVTWEVLGTNLEFVNCIYQLKTNSSDYVILISNTVTFPSMLIWNPSPLLMFFNFSVPIDVQVCRGVGGGMEENSHH